MSAKSLKDFSPPTAKWRPCKVFAKLNRNHLLMANIFKLHKYQTFGLMKVHNMCKTTKSWVDQKISNFQQTFFLRTAFKELYCRVYCYFYVLLIKMIQAILSELKQQLWRPVYSTLVDPYTSIFQICQTFAQIFDSLKLSNVSNISLKKEPLKKHKFFIFLKGGLFVMGGPIDINFGIF